MKRFLPLILFLVYCFQLTAQKACFIKGSFIAAFYSKHDQKIKLVNTFTDQVFSWFTYTGPEPVMWFADNVLVVLDNTNVTLFNFQNNSKTKYILKGKLIPNTILEIVDRDGAVIITQLVSQQQIAYLQKTEKMQLVAACMSGNEKKIVLQWKKNEQQYLNFYDVAETLQLKWQLNISNATETAFVLNLNGTHLAKWNGKETELIETGSQKAFQVISNNNRCLRFNSKDELICIDKQNQSASLYSKNKESVYKSSGSIWFTNRIVISPDKQESFIEWDESFVSDDLVMAIGFGTKCVALMKNGLVLLFFDQK